MSSPERDAPMFVLGEVVGTIMSVRPKLGVAVVDPLFDQRCFRPACAVCRGGAR